MTTSNLTLATFTPATFTPPKGFEIPVNHGLHGNMAFFEIDPENYISMTFEGSTINEHGSLVFEYRSYDSDEGSVMITYVPISGDLNDPEGFDVEIATGSDVWGLEEHQTHICAAIKLHKALGHCLHE